MDGIPRQTFRWAIGQTKLLRFRLTETPAASVSSWVLELTVRKDGVLVDITKTSGDGITCTDATNGVWEVLLPNEDTTDADKLNSNASTYEWALWRTNDGFETPLALGTFALYRTSRTG